MSKPVAIITGAGKGIGRATALALASKGYDLVLVARSEADLQETSKLAGGALVITADIAARGIADQIVAKALERFDRVDALVNNAGYAPVRLIEELSEEDWQRTIDTNLSATFYFCKAAWPVFRKQKSGVIVNMSSLAARDPFTGFSAYGAAKAGINLLGLSLGREGEEHGIRVHTVAPGATETGMFREIATKEQYPEDKTLRPENVAAVIVQCICGDLQHTSGEVIYVHKRLK
jgi:NAD(P)-dependent dehydrogenase (short-subunit alcohol dehydrogenase family)